MIRESTDQPAPRRNDRLVARWLFVVCACIVFLVAFGGYVRLSRAGLSIVEWDVVTGVLPPLGEAAWEETFARYQATPEYQHVNANMTLAEYKTIFYIEYIHRLAARLAGMILVVPLLVFLWRGIIPWRRSGVYVALVLLFLFQAFLGWYMVQSGLIDRPSVSHFRLTVHLLTALTLLAACFWQALRLRAAAAHSAADPAPSVTSATGSAPAASPALIALRRRAALLLALLVLQIAYGGLVAGLKAGHVSDTWPLMFGRLVPAGLLDVVEPWWANLVSAPLTVHFAHRWIAFAVLAAAVALSIAARRAPVSPDLRGGMAWLYTLLGAQIVLGISVIWWRVPWPVALAHQSLAVVLLLVVIWLNHTLRHPADPTIDIDHPASQTA